MAKQQPWQKSKETTTYPLSFRFKGNWDNSQKYHKIMSHSSIHTVDGQNPKQPPGMLKKNLFINGDNHHPWWCRILSSPFFVASLC